MKINCESVGFKNFLSFGSKWQDVELKQGVNFVTGWDVARNKSNGAGKSSFLESIIFALFGKTARDIKKEQIVNWKNKKNCEVVFRFNVGDTKYEVLRAIKPDKLEIYKNGSLIPQDAHVKDYQSMFEEDIWGLDLKMTTSLVHSNVNSSANILSMKKPEKRKLMEKMFDLTVFSKMNEISNEKLRTIQGKTRETELKIQSHLEQIEKSEKMIEKFQEEIKKKAILEKELADLLIDFEEMVDDHPNIEKDIEDITKEIAKLKQSLIDKLQLIEKKEAEIDVKIDHIEKELKEVVRVEDILENNKDIEKRIKAIEKKNGTTEQIESRAKLIRGHKDDKVESYEKYRKSQNDIEKEIIEFQTDQKNLEKNLELLKEGTCPVCGTKVDDPKAHYGKEISSCKRKITNRKKKVTQFDEDLKMLNIGIKEIDEELDALQTAKETILTLKSQIQQVSTKDGKELQKELDKHVANLKVLEEKKAVLKLDTEDLISPLNNKLEDMKEEFSKLKRKEREVEDMRTQVRVEQDNIDSFKNMIEEQEDQILKMREKSSQLKDGMLRYKNLKDYIDAIKILLKDEKIKQHMISRIMPYLNKQANYYLSEVDYSFYVKIDKWLDIQIKGPGITKATYDSLSGGERRGIDLAIQLGFLDIARTQAGIFPDLLTFDELLDSSIDGQGIGEILKIVRVKQREANGKFFIISHRSEIDNELIDNSYHVVKENGYSKVVV